MYLQNVRVHINMKFKKFQQTQRFGSMINILIRILTTVLTLVYRLIMITMKLDMGFFFIINCTDFTSQNKRLPP